MANPSRSGKWRIALWLLALVVAGVGIALYVWREPIGGYATTGTAYAAHVGCSCRFIAGRDIEDCAKDKIAGMELITLSDDAEARSVTARFPLVASTTATYREGYGCVLETWED